MSRTVKERLEYFGGIMNENIQNVQEEEFTFKKLWELIKKSGKRLLVFTIIAVIIGAAVAAVIAVTTMGDKEYRGVIEFTHAGIDDGLDPDGNVLDYNRIKSSSVINAALQSMGVGEEKIANVSMAIEENIYIEPYIPANILKEMENNASYTYFPSRYIVKVVYDKGTGFSDTQYTSFVNALMKSYVEYFKSYYSYEITPFVAIGANAIDNVADYYDLIYNYKLEIEEVQSSVNALPGSYSAIAGKLTSQINVIDSYLTELENYILINNVQKEGAKLSLTDNLTSRKNSFDYQAKIYEDQSAALTTAIEKYQQIFESVTVSGDKITINSYDVSTYNALINDNKNAVRLQTTYQARAKELSDKLTLIGTTLCTAENRTYVESGFADLSGMYASLVESVNKELSDYASKEVMNTGVRVVNNAYTVTDISFFAAIVAFVVIVLVGVFAAIIATAVSEKKKAKTFVAVEKPLSEKE